ncbi:MAG: VanW family protein [Firmicutes bacterium]|nr:VanW family protein [Bacillota bacterium]
MKPFLGKIWRIVRWGLIFFIIFPALKYGSDVNAKFYLDAKRPATGGAARQDNEHPLGRRAHGLLIWENDEEFLIRRSKIQALIRMAAFQTTLPDPLPGEEYNVGLAAKMLAGTVVQPGEIFSMNRVLGPRTREKGYREGPAYSGGQVIRVIGGGICKISTTLYNVAILANLEIIERRAHGMLVPYVPPGQDATVSYGTVDFKFRNTTGGPVLIWAEKVENTLFMAFYGRETPPKITWGHKVLYRREYPVIYRYNPGLRPGEERVVQPGAEEIRVRNWIEVDCLGGKSVVKDLGEDYYQPMPKIIETGKSAAN